MRPVPHPIDLCNAALESVRTHIPADLYRDVFDYINRHNEWGLGLETLIDQLSELEIKITADQFSLIERAMASMDLAGDQRVRYLREHGVVA